MAKGRKAQIGDKNVSANGYHYTRTADGWVFDHHLIAEEKLGRKVSENERVRFVDGDRSNLHPDNVEIIKKGKANLRRRKAQIEARISELQGELKALEEEIESEA